MNTPKTRYLNVALVALGLSLGAMSPAQAWDQSRVGQPGTFETIMSIKLPGVYSPKLAVPPDDSNRHYPQPGSIEAWKRAKFPWLYPTSATSTGPICPNLQFAPGSWDAIQYAKMPGLYAWRGCVKSGS